MSAVSLDDLLNIFHHTPYDVLHILGGLHIYDPYQDLIFSFSSLEEIKEVYDLQTQPEFDFEDFSFTLVYDGKSYKFGFGGPEAQWRQFLNSF